MTDVAITLILSLIGVIKSDFGCYLIPLVKSSSEGITKTVRYSTEIRILLLSQDL